MDMNNEEDVRAVLDAMKRTGNNFGRTYWRGSDLASVLGLQDKTTESFDYLVAKAKMECEAIKVDPARHFARHSRVISTPAGETTVDDWALSRLAAYFISKGAYKVAMESYFLDNGKGLGQFLEDKGRIATRPILTESHKMLARADSRVGAKSHLEHMLLGQETIKGLYVMDAPELKHYRNLGDENIYDHMTRTELAINDEVVMETRHNLRELAPDTGFASARYVHAESAGRMRSDILFRGYRGGMLPEHMPVVEKTPRQLAADDRRAIKELTKQ